MFNLNFNQMVSVSIILCSNRIDNLFYASIASVLAQDFINFELIIILNGDAVLNCDEVRRKFVNHSNVKILCANIKGLNFSLNLGLESSTGKYIARMDSDDIAYPNRISCQYEFMEKNPKITVCGGWFNLIDSNGSILRQVARHQDNKKIRRALVFQNPICHPSVMFRRKEVLNIGGYQNAEFAEDYDLWVRLSRNTNVEFANIPVALIGYRTNSNGDARGSKVAYRAVSTTQWAEFIRTGHIKWLIACLCSMLKVILFGR